MKYVLWVPLFFSYCVGAVLTEQERWSDRMWSDTARENLQRYVVAVSSDYVSDAATPPRDFPVKDFYVPQERIAVADFLKSCADVDRQQWAQRIAFYFQHRERLKTQFRYGLKKVPDWLNDYSPQIGQRMVGLCANMRTITP